MQPLRNGNPAGKPNLFGIELRRLRKEAKYTQDEVARLAEVSASYISQLETGKKKPTDKVITQLSKALGIEENRLFIKVGKIKMDLAGTLNVDRHQATDLLTNLSDEEWEEILTYLAYIRVKASILP